ncbi:hypothetical protein B0T10DRAFT_410426 [Thelonectria olida]|uniref:Uncharacterized protein n=1 Tax=Thelonectria olida TaxID=1576542 RepID=A0A9P8W0J9_9HYPO|nr:hypothetical protein B0T10DRAFT_410426 [Thelonectria olida]
MSSECDPRRYEPIPQSEATPIQIAPRPDPSVSSDTTIQIAPSRPASPPQAGPVRGSLNQSWWHRIGYGGLLTLVAGAIIILASCVVLVFLWWGADAARDRRESEFWKTIVSRGWAPRVVTICSATIRTSMVLHSGLIAAATAALILETSGAAFIDMGVLSTERALKSSPLNILPAAFRRSFKAGRSGLFHFLIVAAAILIVLLSTFISTILLSDFATSRIAAPASINSTALTMNNTQARNGAAYWQSQPSANWRFGETKLGEPLAGWDDTGDTYRALLPIGRAELRESLEHYNGPAVVLNLRTFCGSPEFSGTELKYLSQQDSYRDGGLHLFANGSVKLEPDGEPGRASDFEFKCELQYIRRNDSYSAWPLSLCYKSWFDYGFEKLSDSLSGVHHSFGMITLLNTSSGLSEVKFTRGDTHEEGIAFLIPDSLKNLTTQTEGVWTKFYNQSGSEMFGVTTCFVNRPLPMIYNVTISGRSISSEPALNWRRLSNNGAIKQVGKQFGAGVEPRDFENRGILELDIKDSSLFPKGANTSIFPRGDNPSISEQMPPANAFFFSWSMIDEDTMAYAMQFKLAHIAHASLFQSIIQKTLDPAQAVQALHTRLYQMIYYNWQNYFDVTYPVLTVHSTETLIPAQWTGLFLVLGLVGLHFIIVAITMALFAHQTRFSALGETWQTVAQMVSPQTKQTIETGDAMRDKDVKEWAKATGVDAGVYYIARSDESGRVEIQLRAKAEDTTAT